MLPTNVKFDNNRLLIGWDDGHRGVYDPLHLRLACPCAQCVDEITGARIIRPENIPTNITPQEMRPVGRYGVSFLWSDGHDTGIYTFEVLRQLCQCEQCENQ